MPFKWIQSLVWLVPPPLSKMLLALMKRSLVLIEVMSIKPPHRGGGWRVYSPGGGGGRGFIMHVPSSGLGGFGCEGRRRGCDQ